MKIIFTNDKQLDADPPVLAKDNLPDWYKQTETYINNQKVATVLNGSFVTTATIKKCMPVFDVMASGYLIKSWADIEISNKDGVLTYKVDSAILAQHSPKQAGKHPGVHEKDDLVAKFINNWGIKTPDGYSCLFMPPAHRKNIISIMPAVVDTDTYHLAVHFPFTLTDRNFQGIIPQGTPLVQVIPFKRDAWEMEVTELSADEKTEQINNLHSTDYNGYKDRFWESKSYN